MFRLGSIPVRVRAPFFILVLVLGAWLERPDYIAIWAVIAFVSVLAHELGHALMGRAFGLVPQIELHGMGGTTSWANAREVGNARSIAISLAGPCAGFAVAGLLYLAVHLGLRPGQGVGALALELAIFVNVRWGIFNLAPMLPLDGGNVLRSALKAVLKDRGEKAAHVVSMATAGLLLVYAVLTGQVWLGALGAMIGWTNYQGFRNADAHKVDAPLAEAIQKAYAALDRHDGAEAIALLQPVMVPGASAELRGVALRIYSYALLLEGSWDELLVMLRENATLIGEAEMTRYATTAKALGRDAEAERIAALVPRPRLANDFT